MRVCVMLEILHQLYSSRFGNWFLPAPHSFTGGSRLLETIFSRKNYQGNYVLGECSA